MSKEHAANGRAVAPMEWLRRHEGSGLAVAGLVLAAILFVAVNMFVDRNLRGIQLDLTEGRAFTFAEGTRRVLKSLDEPIELTLYYSPALGEAAPRYAAYHDRVRELLRQYVAVSGGKVRLKLINPEPFSDAEDQAVAEGLQGVPVTAAGDMGYFGLVAVNALDGRQVIPFFNVEREQFVEYDLTKLVQGLAYPDLPRLAVLSALPFDQATGMPPGMGGGGPRPTLLEQLNEFFMVEELDPTLAAIPEDLRLLLIIDPSRLPPDMLHAVDRFVHRGGRALVLLDPVIESLPAPPADGASLTDLDTLLRAWGITMAPDQVAGDLDAARRVNAGGRPGNVGDFVAWLSLAAHAFDAGDPTLANVERINLATAGVLDVLPDATTTIQPLMQTGPRSMAIDAARVRYLPDIAQLLREFRPQGRPMMLAARITGDALPAFPDPGQAPVAKPIEVIVLADVDMIFDRFWVSSADFFGQQVVIPTANNADFIINALENLSGGEALAGLRGRGSSYRPFTLIESLRRDAEMVYRAKEQDLQAQLKSLQQQLREAERGQGDAGTELRLSAEQRAAIERFRGDILSVRRELRDVQRALRSDIEKVENWVKVFNIAAVPAALAILAAVVWIAKRWRRTHAGSGSGHPGAAR
ncbi:MAG: Gldg family protein [Rhodospirillales bacterium]|nr:Gldg family protein [Rhodospirillales bacterium]